MDFKDLLTKQGFDLDKVMVLRHRPTEPKAGAGVAAEAGVPHLAGRFARIWLLEGFRSGWAFQRCRQPL
jgi:hypothetical protein